MPKYLLYAADAFMLVLLISTVFLGKISTHSKSVIRPHKILAGVLLVTILVSVCFIEGMLHISGSRIARDVLFLVHIWCATLFLIGVVLLNWFMNGQRNKKHHALVAYITFALGIVTAGTALPIVARF